MKRNYLKYPFRVMDVHYLLLNFTNLHVCQKLFLFPHILNRVNKLLAFIISNFINAKKIKN